jgi:hypothetical protein
MAGKREQGSFQLKLTGTGISVVRPISEITARQIVALVMGGNAPAEPSAPIYDSPAAAGSRTDASTPKAFMTSKRPKTDMEKVTCLAYYLSHFRQVAAFKTRELTELNIEAAQQKLTNPSATARNAVSDGYLSLAGSGRKQITSRGEALVEALPDRDKVQEALVAHPIRKARRKRSSGRKVK